MDVLFADFQNAQNDESGPLLAATLSPVAPAFYLNRLESIYHSISPSTAEQTIGYALTRSYTRPLKYPSPEVNAWSEIYVAYYHAIGEILAQQNTEQRGIAGDRWGTVYDAWKDLANVVIKGYNSGTLAAWTLPVMYMVGKYLRIYAIKADETSKKKDNGIDIAMGGILQDDIAGDEYGKNEKLEDAARVINRMFILCSSDRYAQLLLLRGSRPTDALFAEQFWKNLESGAAIISLLSSSRPISNSTPFLCPKTFSVPSTPRRQTCLKSTFFPSHTLFPSNTTSV